MSKKNEQYTKVPYELMCNKELKDGDKLTLALIYSYYNGKLECFISNNVLAERMGISRTAASERITKLERLGYIQCERTMVNGKERRTIVPLRMVSLVGKPNPLVGKPNPLVGKPNGVSRSTDPSLVGEVGSIILPSLLDKLLDKELDNLLDKEKILKSVESLPIPLLVKEYFENFINGISTRKQRESILEYKEAFNQIPELQQLLTEIE